MQEKAMQEKEETVLLFAGDCDIIATVKI